MKCHCCGEENAEPNSNLCARCWRDQILAMMENSRKWGYGSRQGNRPVMKPKMVVCSEGHRHRRKVNNRSSVA